MEKVKKGKIVNLETYLWGKDTIKEVTSILYKQFPHGHPDFINNLLSLIILHSQKNQGYAQGGPPTGNFDRVSAIKRLYPNMDWASPEGVCIGYMLKQLDCALWQSSQGYEDEGEPVAKRWNDVVVYAVIAKIKHEEAKQKEG